MRKQQLITLTEQELQHYKHSLMARNDNLRSMILVCEKESLYLKYRLQQLRHIQEASTKEHSGNLSLLTEKANQITTVVGEYTMPVLGRVKDGTLSFGKSVMERGSVIGGSIWSFGSSIKNRLMGETQKQQPNSINPILITPPRFHPQPQPQPQVSSPIATSPTSFLQQYCTLPVQIPLSLSTSPVKQVVLPTLVNPMPSPPTPEQPHPQTQHSNEDKSSCKDGKSIIDKLDVGSDQI